jgi:hypothetical protein
MFDPDGIFAAYRSGSLSGRDVRYGVLVTDVGAFTTDFAYVNFDQSFYDEGVEKPPIKQQSCDIGVRQLDESVYGSMRPELQGAIRKLSTSAWENQKRQFYTGKEVAISNPKGGMLIIGEGDEGERIKDEIKAFAAKVVNAKKEFSRLHVENRIDAEVLTGGGVAISLVRKALVNAIRAEDQRDFLDLLSEAKPPRVRVWKEGAWGWYSDERAIELEMKMRRELVRAGSALGGCSVVFE